MQVLPSNSFHKDRASNPFLQLQGSENVVECERNLSELQSLKPRLIGVEVVVAN